MERQNLEGTSYWPIMLNLMKKLMQRRLYEFPLFPRSTSTNGKTHQVAFILLSRPHRLDRLRYHDSRGIQHKKKLYAPKVAFSEVVLDFADVAHSLIMRRIHGSITHADKWLQEEGGASHSISYFVTSYHHWSSVSSPTIFSISSRCW